MSKQVTKDYKIEQTNISKLILQNRGIVQDISELDYLKGSEVTTDRIQTTRGMFCDNIMFSLEIPKTELKAKSTGCPQIKDTKQYQDKYLPDLKQIFSDGISLKATTTVAVSKSESYGLKDPINNVLFRWKLALHDYKIESVETFTTKLLEVEKLGLNVYEIDLTIDLAGCLDYFEARQYLIKKGLAVTQQTRSGNNMVQFIEGPYRAKFYDKIIYNIECANQATSFGSNFGLNIDNARDEHLEMSLEEVGRSHGLTRLEITATVYTGVNLKVVQELTEQISRCLGFYNDQAFPVNRNPLKNYIKNYTDFIPYQVLIKTLHTYFVVWSVNLQTQRIQGTAVRREQIDQETGKFTQVTREDDAKKMDKILSNMFLNLPLILSIDIEAFKFHTHDKANSFFRIPVAKVGFKKPYVHTAILTKKAQFLKTNKPREYIEQFDSDKIKLMYQTKTSKKSLTNLPSRDSREIKDHEIRAILDDDTFSDFLEKLTVSYEQTITADMLHDWESYPPEHQRFMQSIGYQLAQCVETFRQYNDKLELINNKKDAVNDPAREAIKLVQKTKAIELDKKDPESIRLAIKQIVITYPRYSKTDRVSYYIIDTHEHVYITRTPYLQTCLNNETDCTTYEDKTADTTFVVKFRADGVKITSYFWAARDTRLVYARNKTTDETKPVDVTEDIKQAEELKEQVDSSRLVPTIINQATFNKFPTFETLEPSSEVIYKIRAVMVYTKKAKKPPADQKKPAEEEEEKQTTEDLTTYAIELQRGTENIGIFKQNKYLKDVIKLAELKDDKGKPLGYFVPVMFKIAERKYYPADKKGRINTIDVIAQLE